MRTTRIIIAGLVLFALALAGCAGAGWEIDNPYRDVDWESVLRCKANLHTHTTLSDGTAAPAEVIDRYAGLGYTILALTDHDTVGPGDDGDDPERHRTTWPWQAFGRDPEELGMLAVEGNEISRRHHLGSYFCDYGDPVVESEEAALAQIGRRGALAVLFHPGRYDKPARWYADLYRSHPHLVGLEIYNQRDRYPQDRDKWDSILVALGAERPVWGFSNDDMHRPETQLGYSWNIMLLRELSEARLRRAMEEGSFFFCHSPRGRAGPPPPRIDSVVVETRAGLIRIAATGHGRIEWISAGALVREGESIRLSELPGPEGYVRAVVYAREGETLAGTQPFIFRRRAR